MTEVVAFELPITDEGIRAAEADPTEQSSPLSITAIEAGLAETINAELSEQGYALFSADSGRGASGYAVALEIIGVIADVGGATALAVSSIQLTRRLYEKLRNRIGRPPFVSLGTACFLAAAELSERLGHTDFRLHGAGDTRRRPSDSSYTGNDCFYVIFDHGDDLFFYAVDASGKVKYLGIAQMPRGIGPG
jgi:hypothetical protein